MPCAGRTCGGENPCVAATAARSSGSSPPHRPHGSADASASLRHSVLTGQSAHTDRHSSMSDSDSSTQSRSGRFRHAAKRCHDVTFLANLCPPEHTPALPGYIGVGSSGDYDSPLRRSEAVVKTWTGFVANVGRLRFERTRWSCSLLGHPCPGGCQPVMQSLSPLDGGACGGSATR